VESPLRVQPLPELPLKRIWVVHHLAVGIDLHHGTSLHRVGGYRHIQIIRYVFPNDDVIVVDEMPPMSGTRARATCTTVRVLRAMLRSRPVLALRPPERSAWAS